MPCPWPSHHRYVAVCPYSSAEQTGSGPRGGGDIMGAAVGTTGLGDVSPSREQRPTEVTAASREHQAGGRHSVRHARAVGHPGQESRVCTARVSGLRSSGLNCLQCD